MGAQSFYWGLFFISPISEAFDKTNMLRNFLIVIFLLTLSPPALVGDAAHCRDVRLADIGWTDVTATTAVASLMLERLGYRPKTLLLSLPVALKALSNGDVDVFLGNWMPSQAQDVNPYLARHDIEDLGVNLKGAKYTLAVNDAAYNQGVRTFADLSKHAAKFQRKIYGIEPGNEGNGYLLQIIQKNQFGLGDWLLVESSEQGMLMEVANAVKENTWVAFLGWSPHPMNLRFPIHYLDGGEEYFGANFGEAQVHTLTRKNLSAECPNLAKFFTQLTFNLKLEEEIMQDILEHKLTPAAAAKKAVAKDAQRARAWLLGVQTFSGQSVVPDSLLSPSSQWRLGTIAENLTSWLTTKMSPVLRRISDIIETSLAHAFTQVSFMPNSLTIVILSAIAFLIRRSLLYASLSAAGLWLIDFMGYFDAMIKTLVMTGMATLICVIIGVPIGILCARHRTLDRLLSPALDMMQTLPTFVYLLPTLMLFGLGMVPGIISTIIFAIAAPIKFTCLGILQVPQSQREAAASLGANPLQSLLQVEIPLGMPTILAGISQCIMLSLSMVVIAALVGAEGLGEPVVRALNTVNIGMGFESGLAILILAIILGHLLPRNVNEIR